MKTIILSILCCCMSLGLLAQFPQVQNGSFEINTPTSGSHSLFSNGDVPFWSTGFLQNSPNGNPPVNAVVPSIECPAVSTVTANHINYFAFGTQNTYIRNTLQGRVFPGQKVYLSFDTRTHDGCYEAEMQGLVQLTAPGAPGLFSSTPITSFDANNNNGWVSVDVEQTLPAYSSSPCFYDHLDLVTLTPPNSLNREDTESATPPPAIFYDDVQISTCMVFSNDIIYYNIGDEDNCTTVDFTLDCDLSEKKWYYWEFGDGSTLCGPNIPNPTHTYPDAGTYTVQLTTVNTSGCIEMTTAVIEVNCTGCDDTVANFTYQCNNCTPVYQYQYNPSTNMFYSILKGYNCSVSFTSTSTSGAPITSYTWQKGGGILSQVFGNGPTASTVFLASPLGSNFSVCLTVTDTDGCTDQVCKPVYLPCRRILFPNIINDDDDELEKGLSSETTEINAEDIASGNVEILSSMEVHPNPASNYIILAAAQQGTIGNWNAQIYDFSGKLVKNINGYAEDYFLNTRVDVSDLAVGSYFVRLNSGKEVLTKKVIIQK